MVRVLLFGATGFVGNAIAQSLRRNNHLVYAVARTEEKTLTLSKQELIPILGDASQPETWVPALDLVDIVIDASPSYGGISQKIVEAIKSSPRVKNAKKHEPKLGFIYVSGVWVHGSSPELTTDRVPVGLDKPVKPAEVVGWRPAFEDGLLDKESREVLDVVILRAGVMFGGNGSLMSVWWAPLVDALKKGKEAEEVVIFGRKEASIALVHKDDFAEATLSAAEKFETVSQIQYPVFSVVSKHERLEDWNNAAAKSLGITGPIKYQTPPDPFTEAMCTSIAVDTSRAEAYLGFRPKHTSPVQNAEVYIKAYLYATDYYDVVTGKVKA